LKTKFVEETSSLTTNCDHQHNVDLSIDTHECNLKVSENEQDKNYINILHENSNRAQNNLASIGDSQKTRKQAMAVGIKNQQQRYNRTLEKKEKKKRVQGVLQTPKKGYITFHSVSLQSIIIGC